MTATNPRALLLATLALSFGGGLNACTAAPRYPVMEGEAAGGGLEPLQARYPVRLAESVPETAPAGQPPASEPRAPDPGPAPRAAPTGEVETAALPPPRPAASNDAAPPSAPEPPFPAMQLAQAAPSPRVAARFQQPAVSATPSLLRSSARTGGDIEGPAIFLQRDPGGGPARFTIGAPVPAPTTVLSPGPVESASPTYARPPVAPPPTYARPSAPTPQPYVPSAPTLTPGGAPTYARPTSPPASASPPAYARPPSLSPGPSAPPPASTGGLTGGPRPYGSVFQPTPARPFRSAGIRSTPSNPGIAPQAFNDVPIGPAPTGAAEIASAGRGRFAWPLRGALIAGYGEQGPGQRNDGLDIAANLGDPVRAAAAGEVVYAGDQVPGSGKLVLVKHPGGWVTAYAHLSRIEVRMRDPVAQGQELGQAGQTGSVDRPQLHFEIRYASSPEVKATPINPISLLPNG